MLGCLSLFAFYLFAGKSYLVPDTSKDFSKCSSGKILVFLEHFLLFFLVLDKNIQCRERVLQLPSLITGTILCLIMAYEKIISLIDVPDEPTLFSLSSSSV